MSNGLERTPRRIGLDFNKSSNHPNAKDYEVALRGTIDYYQLPRKVFTQSRDKVVGGAVRILTAYDMDLRFCEDHERNLFALAVADQFFRGARNLTRLKTALNILKVVAVDEWENSTLSGSVQSLAERGKPRGVLFAPNHPNADLDPDYYDRVAEYIDSNEDVVLSQELSGLLRDWSNGSLLHHYRTDLKITPDSENPYGVIVLNKTAEKIGEALGFVAYVSDHRDVPTIVVGSDWRKRPYSVIHEYLHTQEAVDFTRGLKKLAFDGAREAFIGLYEHGNRSYYWVTEGVLTLFDADPDLKQPFAQAFRGDADARKVLLSAVTKRFGFEGLLTLAFMWDTEGDSESYDATTNRIRRAAHIYAGYASAIFESPGYIWRW